MVRKLVNLLGIFNCCCSSFLKDVLQVFVFVSIIDMKFTFEFANYMSSLHHTHSGVSGIVLKNKLFCFFKSLPHSTQKTKGLAESLALWGFHISPNEWICSNPRKLQTMANMGNISCVFIILSWDITIQYNFKSFNTIEKYV